MRTWFINVICLTALWLPVKGICKEPTGNINFAMGVLRTADDFSEAFNLDERIEIGTTCDVKNETWPISIAFKYFLSYGDSKTSGNSYGLRKDKDVDVYCTETYLGIRKVLERFPSVRPFVGGGLYTVNMYVDISYDDEFDTGLGVWGEIGAYIALAKQVDIGLIWRWSKAKINVFGIKPDTGGIHFDLLIGYHF